MSTSTISTKFGTAWVTPKGYYQIASRKEGNHNKFLHRLIWEDFYGVPVPEGFVIHHKNGEKLDNCILNLTLMPKEEHDLFHKNDSKRLEKISVALKGRKITNETKIKMSQSRNKTGYFRVSKSKSKNVKQGFVYRYCFLNEGKMINISSIDLSKLKEKVLARGFEWIEFNSNKMED